MRDEFKIKIIPNKSRTFMLPFLAEQFEVDLNDRLVNTYISFKEEDEEFCLLYDWSSEPSFLKFEGVLMSHGLFIRHEDFNGKTLYRFRLSRNMLDGRSKFIKGLYKEFSSDHKNAISSSLSKLKANNTSRIMEILSPDGLLSSTPPEMSKEVFSKNISKMKITPDNFL